MDIPSAFFLTSLQRYNCHLWLWARGTKKFRPPLLWKDYFRCNYDIKCASYSHGQLVTVYGTNCVTKRFKIISSSHSPFISHSYFFLDIVYMVIFFISVPKAVMRVQGLQKALHFSAYTVNLYRHIFYYILLFLSNYLLWKTLNLPKSYRRAP